MSNKILLNWNTNAAFLLRLCNMDAIRILHIAFLGLLYLSVDVDADSCPSECVCGVHDKSEFHTFSVTCEGNDLTTVPNGIPIQTTDLSLSENVFTRLYPDDFRQLDIIRILYLRDNIIGRIHNETFVTIKNMKHLVGLDLSGNPIDCSCTSVMRDFVQWLVEHRGPRPLTDNRNWVALVDGYNTLCLTPASLTGRRLDELVPSDICGAQSEQ